MKCCICKLEIAGPENHHMTELLCIDALIAEVERLKAEVAAGVELAQRLDTCERLDPHDMQEVQKLVDKVLLDEAGYKEGER